VTIKISTLQQRSWELRREILRNVVADEVVKAESFTKLVYSGDDCIQTKVLQRIVGEERSDCGQVECKRISINGQEARGLKLIKLKPICSEVLDTLSHSKGSWDKVRQVMYSHATLDMTRIDPWLPYFYPHVLQAQLRHFQKIELCMDAPSLNLTGNIFDRVQKLSLIDHNAWRGIADNFPGISNFEKLARALKPLFHLAEGAEVELASWVFSWMSKAEENRICPPFKIRPDIKLEAMLWATKCDLLS
jgi:hypothetical protein